MSGCWTPRPEQKNHDDWTPSAPSAPGNMQKPLPTHNLPPYLAPYSIAWSANAYQPRKESTAEPEVAGWALGALGVQSAVGSRQPHAQGRGAKKRTQNFTTKGGRTRTQKAY